MSNVISIFNKASTNVQSEKQGVQKTEDFEKIKSFNDANSERIKKERQEANKNVLKSYRIKN